MKNNPICIFQWLVISLDTASLYKPIKFNKSRKNTSNTIIYSQMSPSKDVQAFLFGGGGVFILYYTPPPLLDVPVSPPLKYQTYFKIMLCTTLFHLIEWLRKNVGASRPVTDLW